MALRIYSPSIIGDSMATSIVSVKGIGPSTAAVLAKHGFKSAEELADASVEQLGQVPGFGAARAKITITAAEALIRTKAAKAPAQGAAVREQAEKKSSKSKKKSRDSKKNSKKEKKAGKDKKKNKKSGKKNKKSDKKKQKADKKKKRKSGKKKNKK